MELFTKVVEAVRIPLMVQNARNARKNDGSCLEYGLKYHLDHFNSAVSNNSWSRSQFYLYIKQLEKGLPGDPRFPERDNEWIDERTKQKELLVEWLEDFKSKLGQYEEALETIEECEKALELYKKVVDSVRIPLMIQNARNARKNDGSCLEYGLEYHLRNFIGPVSSRVFSNRCNSHNNLYFSLRKAFQVIQDSLKEIMNGLMNVLNKKSFLLNGLRISRANMMNMTKLKKQFKNVKKLWNYIKK